MKTDRMFATMINSLIKIWTLFAACIFSSMAISHPNHLGEEPLLHWFLEHGLIAFFAVLFIGMIYHWISKDVNKIYLKPKKNNPLLNNSPSKNE